MYKIFFWTYDIHTMHWCSWGGLGPLQENLLSLAEQKWEFRRTEIGSYAEDNL